MSEDAFEFRQRVRLVSELPELPAGSEGVVIGFYRRDSLTYAISFGGRVHEVAPEQLVAAEGAARDDDAG